MKENIMKKNSYLFISMALLSLLTLSACSTSTTKNKENTTSTSQVKNNQKTETEKETLNQLTFPQLNDTVKSDETKVTIDTTMGTITLKLFPKIAPKAVENFITHAKEGYYNNVSFHRVIKDFMIQTGDPKGDGTGGESIWKKPFKNEPSKQLYHLRGALSMANAGKDTNGSQFFIVQNNADASDGLLDVEYPQKIIDAYKKGGVPSLDGDYTVFGQVINGMDIVDKIAKTKTDEKDKPKEAIHIRTITVHSDK